MATCCSMRRARVPGRLAPSIRYSTAKRFWLPRIVHMAFALGAESRAVGTSLVGPMGAVQAEVPAARPLGRAAPERFGATAYEAACFTRKLPAASSRDGIWICLTIHPTLPGDTLSVRSSPPPWPVDAGQSTFCQSTLTRSPSSGTTAHQPVSALTLAASERADCGSPWTT